MIRTFRGAGLLAVVALVIGFGSPAEAQLCFGPDGLQGNCWERTKGNLPDLVPFKLEASGICWSKCEPKKEAGVILFDQINRNQCGVYDSIATMHDAAGVPLLVGRARLDYTRTWEETDANGRSYQVWRFLVKVDFRLGQATAPSCIVPPCALTQPTTFYYGYVDFALVCNTTIFRHVAVLFHPCDKFIHDKRHSSRPGTFHPDDYYAIVGPDNAAQPFVPASSMAPFTPPAGNFLGAVRVVAPPGAPDCIMEERLQQSSLSSLGQACACPLDRNLNGVTAQIHRAQGSCPDAAGRVSSYSSVNTFLPGLLFPWFFMVSHHVGAWNLTTADPYPGGELVTLTEGFYRYYDSCTSQASIDVSYGAMTEAGLPVTPDAQRPWQSTDRFLDLASNYSKSQGIKAPFTGEIFPTKHLIYVNIF